MSFGNYRKKFGVPFLTIGIVILFIVSITFGTIGSSAHTNESNPGDNSSASSRNMEESGLLGLLKNNLAAFIYGNNSDQALNSSKTGESARRFPERS